MRRFELILTIAAAFAVFWPVVFGARPRRGIVAVALLAAVVTQLSVEGFRWQMIPVYLAAVLLAVGDVFYLEREMDWSGRLVRGILGALGLLLVAALPLIFPVPEIPQPSGPEAIGTFTTDLIDRSRVEIYGPRPGGPREFAAQVWYPALPDESAVDVPWSLDWEVLAPAISHNMGLPSWFLDHTRYSQSHTRAEMALAPGTFPVVIFSHGYEGNRVEALTQIEQLASNGYIVIAPDHAYVAAATVLGEDEVVLEDPQALPDPDEVDEETYTQAATDLVSTLSGDLVTILNELESGASGAFAPIAESVDLNRIGLYGHSAGGGAAIKTCLEDERCGAVLGMDPWVEPLTERDLQVNMARPALYMRSEGWVDTANDALLLGIAGRGESVTYLVDIQGASHNDFLLTPLLSPLGSQLGLTGTIPAGRVIPIVDNYVVGFFDVFLLGTGSAALDSVTFPEVSVSVIER